MSHCEPTVKEAWQSMSNLVQKTCKPCEGGVDPLTPEQSQKLLSELNGWSITDDSKWIFKVYLFKNYYETMAFVNATAWISHQENHHPDLEVGFKQVKINYTTHAINGLSENDFICAAKMDNLL